MRTLIISIYLSSLAASHTAASAEHWLAADQGKLLLTAGFSTLEGPGGGALTPWATIAGYGSNASWGANAYGTDVLLRDVDLKSFGTAVGLLDRVELSFSHQQLDVKSGALEGLGVSMNIVGIKLRLCGDAVYGQGSRVPQIALGAQYKRNDGIDNFGLTSVLQLGAKETKGVDIYLSATKLSLANSLLINVTLRATRANQLGLLGFGGDLRDSMSLQGETTIAYLLTRKLAVGGEYRTRPRNLSVDNEQPAWDVFLAWSPNKHFSVVGAYANIGSLLEPVTRESANQDGAYVSVQVGF